MALGWVGRGDQVDGGGGVVGQDDAGQEEDDDVGEGFGGGGEGVDEGGGRGRFGGLRYHRQAGWNEAEEWLRHDSGRWITTTVS